ncbi:MAG: cobalamin-dependent protein [Desulfovibrio sp.]|nr:cobalamin-dependent protein [Desulfovibrio sp.]
MQKTAFFVFGVKDHHAGGIRLLSSILKRRGYNVKVLFFKTFHFTTNAASAGASSLTSKEWDLLKETVARLSPAWIGVAYTSFEPAPAKDVFAAIRDAAPEAIIMSGGFGPTFDPVRFLKAGADYVVRGEGEEAVEDIAGIISREKDEGARNRKFKALKNLAWLEDGKLRANDLRPLYDMKEAPEYLYASGDIIVIENDKLETLDPLIERERIYALTSSRGCVGRRAYCDGGNWLNLYRESGNPVIRYRTRKTEDAIAECKKAKNLGATYINFQDEFFIRNEKDFIEFFDAYKKEVGLPFKLSPQTDFLIKESKRFKSIYEAGLSLLALGIQTGSKTLSENVYNRKLNVGEKLKAINFFHRRWVNSAVHFITGHAPESEVDFRASLDFIKQLPFSSDFPARTAIMVFKFVLLPSAPMGELFPILRTKRMDPMEIEYRRWLLRVRHILKDDDEFEEIYRNSAFRDKPALLINLFNEIFNRSRYSFWKEKSEVLRGREVYFYGRGETYQIYKRRFKDSVPLAILEDGAKGDEKIDNIPIIDPAKALRGEKKPIIVFSSVADQIARKILIKFPHQEDITACANSRYPYL